MAAYPEDAWPLPLLPLDLPEKPYTKADTAGATNLNPSKGWIIPCQGRDMALLGGVTDKPNGSIGFVIAYYSGAGLLLAVSQGMTLNAGAFYDEDDTAAGAYPAVGVPKPIGVAGIASIAIIVTDINGNWKLRMRLI